MIINSDRHPGKPHVGVVAEIIGWLLNGGQDWPIIQPDNWKGAVGINQGFRTANSGFPDYYAIIAYLRLNRTPFDAFHIMQ